MPPENKEREDMMSVELEAEVEHLANLNRLIGRFEVMAEIREILADEIRQRNDPGWRTAIAGAVSGAEAYRRCASEVRRVMSGEEPPRPGTLWPSVPL